MIALIVALALAADPSEMPVPVEKYLQAEAFMRRAEVVRIEGELSDVDKSASKDKAKRRRSLEEELRKVESNSVRFYPIMDCKPKGEPGAVGHFIEGKARITAIVDDYTMVASVQFKDGEKVQSKSVILKGLATKKFVATGKPVPLRDAFEYGGFDAAKDRDVFTAIDDSEISRWRKSRQRD